MVKRYRRRNYYRTKKPWSSNFSEGELSANLQPGSLATGTAKLCENPAQTSSQVSQPFTVSRIQLNLQAFVATTFSDTIAAVERAQIGIFYVPQSYPLNENLFLTHPEWLMAYKYIGIPSNQKNGILIPSISITSKLKRTLQTGDAIWMLITLVNQNQTTAIPIRFTYSLRWWTRAN